MLMTTNGNPYFCVREGDGYRILLADHEEVGGEDQTLESVLGCCEDGPSFDSFAELLEAFAADVLPSSPHADSEMAKYDSWRANR